MSTSTRETLGSLVLLAFAAGFGIAAYRLSLGGLHQPDSGFFPFFASAALCMLSIFNLVSGLRHRAQPSEAKEEGLREPINWRNVIIALAALFAFPLLLNFIGFAPALFIFFVVLLRFIEPQRWLIVLGGSAIGAILTMLLFQVWLKVPFPKGVFGL